MIKFFNKIFRKQDEIKLIEKLLLSLNKRKRISELESEFILKILKAKEKLVGEILVPRVDMVFLRENMTLKEAVEIFKREGFSRMPVLGEKEDEVIGILHIKDILKNVDNLNLKVKELVQEAHFIPEYKKLFDAFSYMQKNRISIAIVVDEFGNIKGLVTMEDLLEEIVGEIHDEFDKPETLYKILSDGSYIFHSKMGIKEVEKLINVSLEEKDVFSLGGFIISFLKRVPEKGEKFLYKNLEFEIVEGTSQRIKFVKVKKIT